MFSNRSAAMLPLSVVAILCISSLTTACACAQGLNVHKLGVSIGGQAEFTVDESSLPSYYGPNKGDKVRFEVEGIDIVTLYDRSNRSAFSYELARDRTYINNAPEVLYLHLPDAPGLYGLLSAPFFPAGQAFWKDLSSYFPSLNLSISGHETVLASDSFYHYSYSYGNMTYEAYRETHYTITIETATGIMVKYDFKEKAESRSPFGNYSYSSSNVLSRVETGTSSAISPAAQYLAILVPVILVSTVSIAYAVKMRRTRTGGTRKDQILSRLSDEKLIRLARSISEGEVERRTGRASLTKIIKESLSIEEIRKRIIEGL